MQSEEYIVCYKKINEIICEFKKERINLSKDILKKFNELDFIICKSLDDDEHSKIEFDEFPNF